MAHVVALEGQQPAERLAERFGVSIRMAQAVLNHPPFKEYVNYLALQRDRLLYTKMSELRKDALEWAREAIKDPDELKPSEKIALLKFAADYHPDRKMVKTTRQETHSTHEVVAGDEILKLREAMASRFPSGKFPSMTSDAEFDSTKQVEAEVYDVEVAENV